MIKLGLLNIKEQSKLYFLYKKGLKMFRAKKIFLNIKCVKINCTTFFN